MSKYPEDHEGVIDSFDYRDLHCTVLRQDMGHPCGYVRVPDCPVATYEGIMAYVPVHGGLTYAKQDDGSVVYGFDCAHSHSRPHLFNNPEWMRMQCRQMVDGILTALPLRAEYNATADNEARAAIAQKVVDVAPSEEIGFTGLISMFCGVLSSEDSSQ